MKYLILLVCLICFSPFKAFSQSKQANVWYLGKIGLNFNQSPPQLLTDGALSPPFPNPQALASISDEKGNLLFYTNGETIWNKNHTIMTNGNGLDGHYSAWQGAMIIPKPGSKTLYYVFTSDASERNFIKGVSYSMVDITKQGGLGEVITKNIPLQEDSEETLAATSSCNCTNGNRYWLLADKSTRPGYLYSYFIDMTGIKTKAVESFLPGVYNVTYLKFSSAGDRIAFTGLDTERKSIFGVGDFNSESGLITGLKLIRTLSIFYNSAVEFSPNGKYLYLTSLYFKEVEPINQVIQYDVSRPTVGEIIASATAVTTTGNYTFSDIQTGPDGKIYILTYPKGSLKTLSTIEKPDLQGVASIFLENKIKLPDQNPNSLPDFVSSFLYRNDTLMANSHAGSDKQVCETGFVKLGGASSQSLKYHWSPGKYLSDSTVANPTFQLQGPLNTIKTFQYILTAQDGPCSRKDTVQVTVYPLPSVFIAGSASVCPGVTEVIYQAPPLPGHTYQWRVNGGTLVSGQGSAAIKVNWGQTNAKAFVEVIPTSKLGCVGSPALLPVRINVKLESETPQGLSQVCLNQRENNTYKVTNTTGSIYTWNVQGGTLISGQGTSLVTVNWGELPPYKIWLQEQSTTQDTVCFGISDTLQVTVFKDQTALAMQNVSVSLTNEKHVEIAWKSSDVSRLQGPLTLLRREQGTATWVPISSPAPSVTSFLDSSLTTKDKIYEYQVIGRNGCSEPIRSNQHHTIQLKGTAAESNGNISLDWNPYDGWPGGVEKYEIWRRLDDEPEMKLVGQVSGNTQSFSGLQATAGFSHQYRIKAVARNQSYSSWSNSSQFVFTHELVPPNIITPNGDGQNDVFSIRLIELYPDNQLTIYNRWGGQVYQTTGYNNNWSGANVTEGTYFYKLLLRKTGKQLKGWVEIVR